MPFIAFLPLILFVIIYTAIDYQRFSSRMVINNYDKLDPSAKIINFDYKLERHYEHGKYLRRNYLYKLSVIFSDGSEYRKYYGRYFIFDDDEIVKVKQEAIKAHTEACLNYI